VHEDLFAQAEALARFDSRKPKQVNLRRAISAAYYALFHFLVHEACCIQIGSQHAQAAYRHVLGRAYTHAVMKQACSSFGAGTLKASVIKGLPRDADGNYRIQEAIQKFALAFVELQQKRHVADYDRTERFKRLDVLATIEQAKARAAKFSEIPLSDDKKFFLACLWAWKELTNR
jgi:uncharacterized protein (UPF0332 family)